MASRKLRFFSSEDVKAALSMAEAVELMKEAFAKLRSGQAVVPLRTHVEAPDHGGTALFMPSALPADGQIGLKVVTVFDGNAGLGLPRIQALVLVLDGTTGSPLAVMDGTYLTALRTGAASGAATDLLARQDAESAAILGTGVQGRTQLEAICAVRRIAKVRAFDPVEGAAAAFAREMGAALDIEIEPVPAAAQAVRGADIVCTATTSVSPVFEDEDLEPGVHVNAVGSYQPHVQEIPAETVRRARVVVDHRASALAETGDLIVPIEEQLFSEDPIHAELGEIVLGEASARASDGEVTLFKSVGVAIQDLVAAERVLDNGAQLGLGTEISL